MIKFRFILYSLLPLLVLSYESYNTHYDAYGQHQYDPYSQHGQKTQHHNQQYNQHDRYKQQQQHYGSRREQHQGHRNSRQDKASFESLTIQLREIKRELSETRRETKELYDTLQNKVICEVRELREEMARDYKKNSYRNKQIEYRPKSRQEEQRERLAKANLDVTNDLKEFDKKLKRGLKKITEQGEELKSELVSQKAELYAVRNSVYDTREEILKKNMLAIRGIQEANDTFVCYMHAMRKKLYQVNNNIATVVREQQMLLDSMQRIEYSNPEVRALESTSGYDEPFEDEGNHEEPTASERFLPGCTKNPLETQETLETFGNVYGNESTVTPDPYMKGYDKERDKSDENKKTSGTGRNRKKERDPYSEARAGFERIRAGLDSLFPAKSQDCQENPETFLEYPPMPRDCQDVYDLGFIESGVYRIQPTGFNSREVMCDQATQGGGWTVIVARKQVPRHISFNRTWHAYEVGFGEPSREYWIGE